MKKDERVNLLCDLIADTMVLIDEMEEEGIDSRGELAHLDYLRDELKKMV